MATFRFKLQALLDLRIREEDTSRKAFSTLMGQKHDIEQRLIGHQQMIQQGKELMRSGMVALYSNVCLLGLQCSVIRLMSPRKPMSSMRSASSKIKT